MTPTPSTPLAEIEAMEANWKAFIERYESSGGGLTLSSWTFPRALVIAREALAEVGRLKGERDDFRTVLHDLVMLNAQDEVGCVPAPTREQWAKAWAEAEELTRIEP